MLCAITAGRGEIASAETVGASAAARLPDKVAWIFYMSCMECHGPEKSKSGLRLDSLSGAAAGGDYGPAIAWGAPDQSELIRRVTLPDGDYEAMPPEGPRLDKASVAALREWIAGGTAPTADASPAPKSDGVDEAALNEIQIPDLSDWKDKQLSFSRDIRPILADNCYQCHGPDSNTRKAGLRLDRREDAVSALKGGRRAIVPGDTAASGLVRRIFHSDPDEVMPPSALEKPLTENQRKTLAAWIEQGAEYEAHWAFIPPKKGVLPQVSDPAWPENPIDYFILKGLDDAGLKPSPEADRATLIRRVSLDLAGLPPTPAEVDAFLADDSPDSWEKVVDRLLASPAYGERMAFPWLNEARYSDTNGYQRDTKRTMWPWRDWVIDAFNDNMPFDQFTIEQLAGDLLPDATVSQKIATGFNRNHRINGEGGIIPEEYAVEYVVDRVATTSTVWMGLTMACARCHDHKYDPVTQREFYEMYAFFNRVPENGKGGERGNDKPFLQLPTPEDLKFKAAKSAEISGLESQIKERDEAFARERSESEALLTDLFGALEWEAIRPSGYSAAYGTELELRDDGSLLAHGDVPDNEEYRFTFTADRVIRALRLDLRMDGRLPKNGPGRAPNGNVVLTEFLVERRSADGERTEKMEISDALADINQPGTEYAVHRAIDSDPETAWSVGADIERKARRAVFILDGNSVIRPGDEITVTLRHSPEHKKQVAGRFKISGSAADGRMPWARSEAGTWHELGPFKKTRHSNDILELMTEQEEGYDSRRTYGDEQLRWKERPDWSERKVIKLGGWSDTVNYAYRTFDLSAPGFPSLVVGSNGALRVWVDGKPVFVKKAGRPSLKEPDRIPLFLSEGRHEILVKVVNDAGFAALMCGLEDDGGGKLFALEDILAKSAPRRTRADEEKLTALFGSRDEDRKKEKERLASLKTELEDYDRRITSTMIMEDMADPRDTYLLKRGAYDQPDTTEELLPDVPSILGAMDDSLPRNRLGLARWLLRPDHPLTARVRVNQYWSMYFGRGIVRTNEDFGTQSSLPTNPGLLDFLAVDFIESGWDVKAMQKQIVMSATYRQDSTVTRESAGKDPENLLLGRAPRFRLSAPQIRDQALAVGGLLHPEIGGPSVFPYQPEGMWSSLSFQNMDEYDTNYYRKDTGDKLYRRGLYTYWKRTIAPPRMQIFDAPDREQCSMGKDATNTPLQALALLNDTTFVEAARHLAARMMREGGDAAADRVRHGYKLALAREPDSGRGSILERGLAAYTRHFQERPEDAAALIAVGDSVYEGNAEAVELAAYTMLASVILNLDETITRQ